VQCGHFELVVVLSGLRKRAKVAAARRIHRAPNLVRACGFGRDGEPCTHSDTSRVASCSGEPKVVGRSTHPSRLHRTARARAVRLKKGAYLRSQEPV
jgi:hypothetical protein